MPVSLTMSVTRASSQVASKETVPPPGVYLMALSSRMTNSCSTRSGLETTAGTLEKSVSSWKVML